MEAERDLAALAIEQKVLTDDIRRGDHEELRVLLKLEKYAEGGENEEIEETLVSSVGAEVSARLFAALPGVGSRLADRARVEQQKRVIRAVSCLDGERVFQLASVAGSAEEAVDHLWFFSGLLTACTERGHDHESELHQIVERSLILTEEPSGFSDELPGILNRYAQLALRCGMRSAAVELLERMGEVQPQTSKLEIDREVLAILIAQSEER